MDQELSWTRWDWNGAGQGDEMIIINVSCQEEFCRQVLAASQAARAPRPAQGHTVKNMVGTRIVHAADLDTSSPLYQQA